MLKKSKIIPAVLLSVATALSVSAEELTLTRNKTGKHGEFDYELWCDKGEGSMVLKDDGTFTCSWDRAVTNNILFRTGKKLGSTNTYEELGTITLEYGAEYEPDGNSYLCVYGWSVDPLVEFYIVESWGNWRPPGGGNPILTFDSDDGTYDIYETTRTNMPSIQGTKTFQQYWSVRTEKKSKGTITVSDHFKMWQNMGLQLGKLYEIALCVEGFQSSGYANVYSNKLTIGDTSIGIVQTLAETTTAPTEATTTTAAPPAESETVAAPETTAAPEVESETENVTAEGGNNIPVFIAVGVAIIAAVLIIIGVAKRKK